MQDDSFPAAERILADIEAVFRKDPKLKEFDIVPVTENHNKSPVLHVEHSLGLESWCVRHVYCYAYHRLMDARQMRSRREDPAMLARLLMGALLLNPDVMTFWNMRRELMQAGRLDVQGELHFTAVLLSRKPKSAEAFAHRKWVVGRLLLAGVDVDELLEEELRVSLFAAERYSNNYHAWSHRMWCLTHLVPSSSAAPLLKEWATSESWLHTHVSDHSGMQYRQFLLSRMLELKPPALQSIVENAKKSLLQLLSSSKAIPLSPVDTKDDFNIVQFCSMSTIMNPIALIASELVLNTDLIQRFAGHEALWCHRRYLLTSFKKFLSYRGIDVNGTDRFGKLGGRNKFDDEKNEEVFFSFPVDCYSEGSEKFKASNNNDVPQNIKSNSHKNMDGVPLEKDQKLCSEETIELGKHEREIFYQLHKAVVLHEIKLMNTCRPDELHQQRLAKQHQKWLLHVLKKMQNEIQRIRHLKHDVYKVAAEQLRRVKGNEREFEKELRNSASRLCRWNYYLFLVNLALIVLWITCFIEAAMTRNKCYPDNGCYSSCQGDIKAPWFVPSFLVSKPIPRHYVF